MNTKSLNRSLVFLTSLLLMITLLISMSGCNAVEKGLSMLKKPSATPKDARISRLTLRDATLEFDVEIKNPYQVPLPLIDLSYKLSSGRDSLLNGKSNLQGSVPSGSQKIVSVPATFVYKDVINTVKDIRPGGVIPYRADLTVSVDVPRGGSIDLPMSTKGTLPVPAVPEVSLESIQWKQLNFSQATALLQLQVKNPHQFPVTLKAMNYDLKLGGRSIVDSQVSSTPRFESDQARTIEIPVSFSMVEFGTGLLSLFRGDQSSYEMSGQMELNTPYGLITIPYDAAGKTLFKDG